LEDITFHTEHFEGPLDLLLHLIRKNKVHIYDIPVAEILSQYLRYLEQSDTLDMEQAGDFIAMAAQLMYIKSKMLLPALAEEEDDPRTELVQMLLEYKRYKEVSVYFRQRTDAGRDVFVKQPELLEKSRKAEYRNHPEELVQAAKRISARAQNHLPPPLSSFAGIIKREVIPVSAKISDILAKFLRNRKLDFKGLMSESRSRSELVAAFLAVLELSKNRKIHIEGENDQAAITFLGSRNAVG
jgi:segregation and condensation protein A